MPNVQPQPGDQVGATPLSWNTQDSVEKALQEAKSSAYSALKPYGNAGKAYLNWRAQQVPTVESVSQGNIPVAAGTLGSGWNTSLGKTLTRLLGPEWMSKIEAAPGAVSLDQMAGPVLKRFQNNALGVTLPSSGNMAQVGKGLPLDATVHMGPMAGLLDVAPQTGVHEAFGHGLSLAESGRPMYYSPSGGMNVIQREMISPSIEEHSPQYLTRLLQFYRNNGGTGGPAHAAIELEANRLAARGGQNPYIRGTELPILDPTLLERLRGGK